MAATVSSPSSSLHCKRSIDLAVQHTNDDSIVSKRSSVRLGYCNDEYLRHYVKKAVRRTPLINRGYYLRIKAMTSLIEECLSAISSSTVVSSSISEMNSIYSVEYRLASLSYETSIIHDKQRVQVLSLGAGFDTLAARLYLKPEYQHVHFYEVDFPEVVNSKTLANISNGGMINFPYLLSEGREGDCKDTKIKDDSDESRCIQKGEMHFIRYHCIGFDLRQASGESDSGLAATLVKNGFDLDAPTVVYAECVMQYMPPEASTKLIKWITDNIKNSMFLAYDQINPYDSFGQRMQSALASKHSPLLGVNSYSDGWFLSHRAREAGLIDVRFANFYDISSYYICESEKDRIDKLEAFDEFEEWSEMCEHYGILYGRSQSFDTERYGVLGEVPILKVIDAPMQKKRESMVESLCPQIFLSQHTWPSSRFSKEGFGNGGFHAEYITLMGGGIDGTGSSYQTLLVGFGGIATKNGITRDDTLTVHAIGHPMGNLKVIEVGTKPCARAYHSFTRLRPWVYVVFGGRTNPNHIMNDTFLLELEVENDTLVSVARWSRLLCSSSDAPCPRYRHIAVGYSDEVYHSVEERVCGKSCPDVLFIQGGRTLTAVDPSNENEIQGCEEDLNHSEKKRKKSHLFTTTRISDMWIGNVDIVSKTIWWDCPDVKCECPQLPPLCSASAVRLETGVSCDLKVLITGGLLHDFQPSNSAWEVIIPLNRDSWHRDTTDVSNGNDVSSREREKATVNQMKWTIGTYGRFSHTMTLLPDRETVLILGGSGFVPKSYVDNFPPVLISKEGVVTPIALPESLANVTLTLHSVVPIYHIPVTNSVDDSSNSNSGNSNSESQTAVLAVVGGGFMCFSFGQYTLTPFILKLSTLSMASAQEPVIFPSSDYINNNNNNTNNNNNSNCNGDDSDVGSIAHDIQYYLNSLPQNEAKRNIIGVIPIWPRNHFPSKYTIDSYSAKAWDSILIKGNSDSGPTVLSGPLRPYLFRKIPVGKCIENWSTDNVRKYFCSENNDIGKTRISVHVARGSALNFINKNFEFRHVTLSEMIEHCFPQTCMGVEGTRPVDTNTTPEGVLDTLEETWYFRSVGSNMKTESSNFYNDFPLLAGDFSLPKEIQELVLNPKYHHQSCLRINQKGMQLWTHYDIMDNILINITGLKRVVLYHPSQISNLYVPNGSSSSPITDIDNVSLKLIRQYPNYVAAHLHHATMETVLGPGDMLVIPALWFHHITAVEPCISINLFYKRPVMCMHRYLGDRENANTLQERHASSNSACNNNNKTYCDTKQKDHCSLYDPKDLYGNKDLPSMVEMREEVLSIIKKNLCSNSHSNTRPRPPPEFIAFTLQQLVNDINELSHRLYLETSSSSVPQTNINGK